MIAACLEKRGANFQFTRYFSVSLSVWNVAFFFLGMSLLAIRLALPFNPNIWRNLTEIDYGILYTMSQGYLCLIFQLNAFL